MASGKTHTRVNMAVTAALIPISALTVGIDGMALAFLGGMAFGTLFMSPDIDTDGTDCDRRWGWVLEKLWNPYSFIVPHRGISHWFIVGTITRLAYLGFWVLLAIAAAKALGFGVNAEKVYASALSLRFYAGVFVADCLHLVLDWKP